MEQAEASCEGDGDGHSIDCQHCVMSNAHKLAVLTLTLLVWLLFTYRNSLYTWLVLIIVL